MKDMYELDRESLVELSKRVYEEACLGYMDLKESTCEKLVEEFLEGKKKQEPTKLNSTMDWTISAPGNWDGGIGVPNQFGSGSTIVVGPDPMLEVAGLSGGITITNGDTMDVVLRNPDQDMLRGNYHGNESERI